ncbi:MAG: NUDIX hydrolase [Candidatus Omnitrophica bacterium]|nr:NUDIX hydrolase [Candidatus Omnitrophota bacterium]
MGNVKVIMKGKLLGVTKEQRRLPNGHTCDLEIVQHPGAALVVPFVSKDKVILLKQFRPVINSYIYELPAGTLEKKETPLACAKREMIEEIGYCAKKITKLGFIYPLPGYCTEKITVFRADGLEARERILQKDEIIFPYVFSKKQVKEFFRNGKIVDSKTICAFALCGWL